MGSGADHLERCPDAAVSAPGPPGYAQNRAPVGVHAPLIGETSIEDRVVTRSEAGGLSPGARRVIDAPARTGDRPVGFLFPIGSTADDDAPVVGREIPRPMPAQKVPTQSASRGVP